LIESTQKEREETLLFEVGTLDTLKLKNLFPFAFFFFFIYRLSAELLW